MYFSSITYFGCNRAHNFFEAHYLSLVLQFEQFYLLQDLFYLVQILMFVVSATVVDILYCYLLGLAYLFKYVAEC